MEFRHADAIWRDHPALVPAVLSLGGVTPDAGVAAAVAAFTDVARARLADGPESGFPEIQAWRRAFTAQGLKPTQYRCASESLLRRLRREGDLPALHPLVDLCNAVSAAFAVPVAALDLDRIDGDLAVRYADGTEEYETFGGELEHPDPREVVFADAADRAHARRWTNRQSGRSAIRPSTTRVLVVAEALHASAAADVPKLLDALAGAIADAWHVVPRTAILRREEPAFRVRGASPAPGRSGGPS
ncbi:B3/4 domain-containing protein [Dactylosporangium sucinum]|uniref:B3/B4 domain-containing protein n=1 Tax=Dactylosporangium sucinum TaxID=1424081 RepID=UPI00167D0D1F|nr:phenylalanine--tRNA ligase beta subunit-related protein [Dactylosporangium sucinum]